MGRTDMCGCNSLDQASMYAAGYINLGVLPCGHIKWGDPLPSDRSVVVSFWASCGPCYETWTIDSHPDWLPYIDAQKELGDTLWSHAQECPVRRRPNEMGVL